jgi:hypothetical protein
VSQNGKGSAPRQRTAQERKRFEDNYDAIFRKPGWVRIDEVEVIPITDKKTQRLVKRAFANLARHRKKK